MKRKVARIGLVMVVWLMATLAMPMKSAKAFSCTSTGSGNWSASGTWTGCNGDIPGAGDDVTILASHNVTVDVEAYANNVLLQGVNAGTRLTLNATLNVSGTLSADGTTFSALVITGSGKIKFVGTSRALFGTIWAANPQYWSFEVALDSGAIGTASTNIKAGFITISSGTFQVGTLATPRDLRPDAGTGAGILTVSSGATLVVYGNISRTSTVTTQCASITINGTLALGGSNISATNIYVNSGGKFQSLRTTGHTVTGTLAYAVGSILEYAGTSTQTTLNELSSSVQNLTISNINGVTLNSSTTVNGTLALTAGDLNTGSYTLTMGDAATTTGDYDVVGSVRRTNPTAGTKTYGSQYTSLNFASSVTGDVIVTMQKSVSGFNVRYVNRRYDITVPSGTADVRLHYRCEDLSGSPVETALSLWRFDGSRWVSQGRDDGSSPQCPGGNAGYVQKNGVSTFSSWAITDNGSPTAVILSTFDARRDDLTGMSMVLGASAVASLIAMGCIKWRQRRETEETKS